MYYPQLNRDTEEHFSTLETLPDRVQLMLRQKMMLATYEHMHIIKQCESPIEQLLAIGLVDHIEPLNLKYFVSKPEPPNVTGYFFSLHSQETIEVENKTYRADFVISIMKHDDFPDVPDVVIECDGHDYHDRTKEQASRDRKRDRLMQAAGYHVLRYTGSDIWRDPSGCAQDVRIFVERIVGAAFEKHLEG